MNDKNTVAVLIHIDKTLYQEYLKTLKARSLQRQSYSKKIFEDAIKRETEAFELTNIS